MKEPTVKVPLTLEESGTLCHILMGTFLSSGGINKQPEWALDLYQKLAKANDKLMGKECSK